MTVKKPIHIREERRGEVRPAEDAGAEDVERRLFGGWFKPVVGALVCALVWLVIAQFRDAPVASSAALGQRLDVVEQANQAQWSKIAAQSERVAILETKMSSIEKKLDDNNDVSLKILKILSDDRK